MDYYEKFIAANISLMVSYKANKNILKIKYIKQSQAHSHLHLKKNWNAFHFYT